MNVTTKKTETQGEYAVLVDGREIGKIKRYVSEVHVTDGTRLSCGTVKDCGWKSGTLKGRYGSFTIREKTKQRCAEELVKSLQRNGLL